jgi:NAD dependent epimerase/dehydratase
MGASRMSYDGIRALVTGADGFIGSHLTEALVAANAKVTALAMYNALDGHGWLDDLPETVMGGVTVVRGDVRDGGFVRGLVQGHSMVFHLAALIAIPYSYVAPQSYVATNVLGTLNVIEAAHNFGVARVVHTSTSEVYGTAQTTPIDESHPLQGQSPYSASKIGADMMVESFVRSYGLPAVILRPFNTFGPRQSERAVIPTVLRQALDPRCDAIRVGDTATVRDFTFVADTVAAFMAAGAAVLTDGIEYGWPYNAGSEKAVSVADVIAVVREVTGCNKPVLQEGLRLRPAESEVRVLLANSLRFRRATGWAPEIDLRRGIELTAAWWRERIDRGLVRRQNGFML